MNEIDHAVPVSRETSATAEHLFGERIELARRFVELLAGPGVERGLLGPREVPRIWERHILNSAVAGEFLSAGWRVADVGSGAGLPGIPLALARPDVEITLIEPQLRRTVFLAEVLSELNLSDVRIVRARAEDVDGGSFDAVVARAVAPMGRLARWTLPLLRPGGALLAIKGDRARRELEESAASLTGLGAQSWRVVEAGKGLINPPTRVAMVWMGTGEV